MNATHTLFAATYADARTRFVEAANRAGADLEVHTLSSHVGPLGEPLGIDVVRLGKLDADVIVLCLSGTHGAEGFAGSAAQTAWLLEGAMQPLPSGVAVVLVHAVNPFGFAHLTRLNENGVDLNRNAIDFTVPAPTNYLYGAMHPLVQQSVDEYVRTGRLSDSQRRQIAGLRDALTAEHGRWAVADAIERGQYEYPGGLEYGGDQLQWSLDTLFRVVRHHTQTTRHVAYVDWHTLLRVGDGNVVPLCFNQEGDPLYLRCASWWDAVPIDRRSVDAQWAAGTSARLPRTSRHGLVMWGVQHAAAPYADVAGAVVEFGADVENSNFARSTHEDPLLIEEIEAHARAHWLIANRKGQGPEVTRRRIEARNQFSPPRRSWERASVSTALQIMQSTIEGAANWAAEDIPAAPGLLVRTNIGQQG